MRLALVSLILCWLVSACAPPPAATPSATSAIVTSSPTTIPAAPTPTETPTTPLTVTTEPPQIPATLTPFVITAGVTEPGDELRAQDVLTKFFALLEEGAYAEAVEHYGGDYSILRDWNPAFDPSKRASLLQQGCEINGLMCLSARQVTFEGLESTASFKFSVQFQNADGSLFVRGPCCGANATEQPPESEFEYTVVKDAAGRFWVMGLPPSVP